MSFLNWEDYVIIVITLVILLGIGLYYSKRRGKQRSLTEYFLGNSNMSALPVAFSLMVSFQSGIMMLGLPAEVYMYGMQWYLSKIGECIGDVFNCFVIVPHLKRLQLTSIFQLNYLGTVLFVPAVTLETVADIPQWVSIVGLMSVVLIYTFIGGFKAVIWTDVFQCILMFGGILAILIQGTLKSGGVEATWNTVAQKGRLNFFNFNPDPTIRQSFWSLLIGAAIVQIGIPFQQISFQRIKATRTVQDAKRMYLMTNLTSTVITLLVVLEGAVMFAYYDTKGCDPLVSKQVTNQNQISAKLVIDIFHGIACLRGLFLASLFSASLSTMSSILNSLSAIFWEDIVKPHTKPLSNRTSMLITYSSVLLFGIIGVVVAFVVCGLRGPVSQIIVTTNSCLNGAITGIFILGWFVPRANKLGAFVGGLISVLFIGWISFGKYASTGVRASVKLEPASTDSCVSPTNGGYLSMTNFTDYSGAFNNSLHTTAPPEIRGVDVLYSLSYMWLRPLGITIVLLIGPLISRIQAPVTVDPSLVIPIWGMLGKCLPRPLKAWLREDGNSVRNTVDMHVSEDNEKKDCEERQEFLTEKEGI